MNSKHIIRLLACTAIAVGIGRFTSKINIIRNESAKAALGTSFFESVNIVTPVVSTSIASTKISATTSTTTFSKTKERSVDVVPANNSPSTSSTTTNSTTTTTTTSSTTTTTTSATTTVISTTTYIKETTTAPVATEVFEEYYEEPEVYDYYGYEDEERLWEYSWDDEYYYFNAFTISKQDYILLCNVVAYEYGAYWVPEYDKALVVEVVMNRVWDPCYPDTIYDVITQPNQFEGCWRYANMDEFSYKVTDSVETAVGWYLSYPEDFNQGYIGFWGDGYYNYFR